MGDLALACTCGQVRGRLVGLGRLLWRVGRGILLARISGRWKDTPFFEAQGAPMGPVTRVFEKTHAALFQSAG